MKAIKEDVQLNGNPRLFVPLAHEPHDWFASGRKKWELRRYGRQYTEKHLLKGRRVELRRGYRDSSTALWGVIRDIYISPSIRLFYDKIQWFDVIPSAENRAEAEHLTGQILGIDPSDTIPVVGFSIDFS